MWIDFCEKCGYLPKETTEVLMKEYDIVISQLVHMSEHTEDWLIRPKQTEPAFRKVSASGRPRVSASVTRRENS